MGGILSPGEVFDSLNIRANKENKLRPQKIQGTQKGKAKGKDGGKREKLRPNEKSFGRTIRTAKQNPYGKKTCCLKRRSLQRVQINSEKDKVSNLIYIQLLSEGS